MNEYIKLGIAALMPVAAAALIYFVLKKAKLESRVPRALIQVVIGIIFGALACIGTHWGIKIDGAMVNARDAAVLTAGLMFGGPAGIIAGIIGGGERVLATLVWDIGSFTVVACSVSTFLAGVYAAALRRFMFDRKKPGWFISLAIGVVIEVFHLTMVFVTNMQDPERAMTVVKACTIPMLSANGISVMLSAMVISLIAHEQHHRQRHGVKISQKIQRELLVTVVLTFFLTSAFLALFQTAAANEQANGFLQNAIEEVQADISDASDANMLRLANAAATEYKSGTSLRDIAIRYNVSEVNMIGRDGVIYDSSAPEFIGYDMASSEQSAPFLDLLHGKNSMVQPLQAIGYNDQVYRKYAGVALKGEFIQVGYDAARLQSNIDGNVIGIAKNRHIGSTGYIVILDSDYKPVSAPEDFDIALLDAEADTLNASIEGVTFEMTLGDVRVLSRAIQTEGYSIIAIFPRDEAMGTRNAVLYLNTFIEILVFALMFAFIYLVIKVAVVNQIKRVNSSLGKITKGNLNEIVDVRSSVEFASLSDDINSTVTTLKGYISEAERRMEEELEFAKTIQHSALPSVFPAYPGREDFDIYATMDTAKEVGGDFYDFYLMENGSTICTLIADVSGKGIPAAMFMMRAKTLLRSLTENGVAVNDVFTSANNALCNGNDAGMFVTAWEGLIDLETGDIRFSNAGHNPPVVKRRGAPAQFLASRPGFILAGMEGIKYKEGEFSLHEGDLLFLYTDGVTEAQNKDGELFGEARLLEVIDKAYGAGANEISDAVKAALSEFVGEADQFDDITTLSFIYNGKKLNP